MTNAVNWKWDNALNHTLFEIRKHLHQHPELSFKEYETQKYIQKILDEWHIPYKTITETGLYVDIEGAKDGKHIALRADIDALPITEKSNVDFPSQNKGVMHACGHDGHTTILLGAVYHLWQYREQLKGSVRCIFQPGEEADGAAEQLIQTGVLTHPNIENIIALHVWPKLPLGTIGTIKGPVTASCDDFVIKVHGKGGHAARPYEGIDALAVTHEIVQSLKFLETRMLDPVKPHLIHVGKIEGGQSNNAIADEAIIEGSIRTVDHDMRQEIETQFIRLVNDTAERFGSTVDITYINGHPPVINDDEITDQLEQSAKQIVGEDHIIDLGQPSMGADDFGYYSEQLPSTYFRLGISEAHETTYDLHHPQFKFNEQAIIYGAKIFTQYALDMLR
ncbi:M20 metallopeptidase family protein [Staphylococcus sp. 11261D007BR]